MPLDFSAISCKHFLALSFWACCGIPLGFPLSLALGLTLLKLLGALVILGPAIQLMFSAASQLKGADPRHLIGFGGATSTAMTGALAVPGPVALWALLSAEVDAITIRGTLRAYFMVAYSLALALHLGVSGLGIATTELSLSLAPAVIGGIALGLVGCRLLHPRQLRRIFEVILVVMGLSMLAKGILDAL